MASNLPIFLRINGPPCVSRVWLNLGPSHNWGGLCAPTPAWNRHCLSVNYTSCDRLRKCLTSQLKAVSWQTMLYSMACFQNDKQKFLSHWSIALLGDKTTSVFRVLANTIDRRPLPEALSVQSVLLSFRIRSFGIFFFLSEISCVICKNAPLMLSMISLVFVHNVERWEIDSMRFDCQRKFTLLSYLCSPIAFQSRSEFFGTLCR